MTSPAVTALPQITAPRQARSRATMSRVLAVFTALLRERPFDQLTMAEISMRSAASLPSIYARFEDKNALLLAAHETFKIECEARIDHLAEEFAAMPAALEDVLHACARQLCDGYRDNAGLLRSALLSGSPVIYQRAAELMQRCADRIAGLVRLQMENADACVDDEIDFAMRAAFALMQQALLFGGDLPSAFARSDTEIPRRIADLLVAAARQAKALEAPQ